MMKSIVLLSALMVPVHGFVPPTRRSHIVFQATANLLEPTNMGLALSSVVLCSTAALMKEKPEVVMQMSPSLTWRMRKQTNDDTPALDNDDGIVSAMAILKQAKLELSDIATDASISSIVESESTLSFAEKWERSVFDAMERLELHIEERASVTGQKSLQFVRSAVEPLRRIRIPWVRAQQMIDIQKLETLERAVFDEMERLEHFIEMSASKTGTYSLKLIKAAIAAVREIEIPLEPEARRAKIIYTQKLASMVRDLANRLETQAEQEKLAVEYEEVLVTSVYRTRVRPTQRRRSGIISSFFVRMVRKINRAWRHI